MRIAVLGSTGATGRQLLSQALDRGRSVVALARDPSAVPAAPSLEARRVDVHDPAGLAAALAGVEVVVSGLGAVKGGRPGTLTAGAQALVAVSGPRLVWLTALGSGSSAASVSRLTRAVLPLALGRDELADKARAEELVLAAGGSVLAAGPLTDGPLSASRRTLALADAPRRVFPARVSRTTVAAVMLDEAEHPQFPAAVAVPLG